MRGLSGRAWRAERLLRRHDPGVAGARVRVGEGGEAAELAQDDRFVVLPGVAPGEFTEVLLRDRLGQRGAQLAAQVLGIVGAEDAAHAVLGDELGQQLRVGRDEREAGVEVLEQLVRHRLVVVRGAAGHGVDGDVGAAEVVDELALVDGRQEVDAVRHAQALGLLHEFGLHGVRQRHGHDAQVRVGWNVGHRVDEGVHAAGPAHDAGVQDERGVVVEPGGVADGAGALWLGEHGVVAKFERRARERVLLGDDVGDLLVHRSHDIRVRHEAALEFEEGAVGDGIADLLVREAGEVLPDVERDPHGMAGGAQGVECLPRGGQHVGVVGVEDVGAQRDEEIGERVGSVVRDGQRLGEVEVAVQVAALALGGRRQGDAAGGAADGVGGLAAEPPGHRRRHLGGELGVVGSSLGRGGVGALDALGVDAPTAAQPAHLLPCWVRPGFDGCPLQERCLGPERERHPDDADGIVEEEFLGLPTRGLQRDDDRLEAAAVEGAGDPLGPGVEVDGGMAEQHHTGLAF